MVRHHQVDPVPRCLHWSLCFQEHPWVQDDRCFLPFLKDPPLLEDPSTRLVQQYLWLLAPLWRQLFLVNRGAR